VSTMILLSMHKVAPVDVWVARHNVRSLRVVVLSDILHGGAIASWYTMVTLPFVEDSIRPAWLSVGLASGILCGMLARGTGRSDDSNSPKGGPLAFVQLSWKLLLVTLIPRSRGMRSLRLRVGYHSIDRLTPSVDKQSQELYRLVSAQPVAREAFVREVLLYFELTEIDIDEDLQVELTAWPKLAPAAQLDAVMAIAAHLERLRISSPFKRVLHSFRAEE
jgi:hypothetical protein